MTLAVSISKNQNNSLQMNNPAGQDAIELGAGGAAQFSAGSGYSGTAQMDKLLVTQPGSNAPTASVTLDLTQNNPPGAITHTFPNGAQLYLYHGGRATLDIRANNTPSAGEDDLEFTIWVSDANGQYPLDPEIRVKSSAGSGTATWTTPTSS